jgi:dTDP-4-dehydrorhamnose reductase
MLPDLDRPTSRAPQGGTACSSHADYCSEPMTKVLVLGAHGMLGSMVARVLAEQPGVEVTTTARGDGALDTSRHRHFDATADPLGPLLDSEPYEWIVNAIGVIKPRIDESVPASVENAIMVNSVFPARLAAESDARGQRVVQIATDCVFSGTQGAYDESAPHDPVDVYGKTKSLGETPAGNVTHLRCSIIGPELSSPPSSLLGWILSAPRGGELSGYTDHFWNGVTTLQFARLCAAIVGGATVPRVQHVVPGDSVSKADLLQIVLSSFHRDDVRVRPGPGPSSVDRTLSTQHSDSNQSLWMAAGYDRPPTIRDMVTELAAYSAAGAERAA